MRNILPRSDGAVVVGGYVNGLGIARALASRGRPVAVVTTKPYDIAQYSNSVSETQRIDCLEERPEALAEVLERFSGKWTGRLVYPTNDEAMAALSIYYDRLSSWYRLAVPSPGTVQYLLDKDQMLKASRETGVPVPRCFGPATDETALKKDLTYPLVVKPTEGYRFYSQFGTKLFIAKDGGELRACIRLLERSGLTGIVQDLVPGPDSHIYEYCVYMDKRGNPSAGLTTRKIRQTPMFFGVARVAELVKDNKELSESSVEILRRIGFRGAAFVEFKLDPRDGTFRFIEVNGRSVKFNKMLRYGGMDVADLVWSDYVEGKVKPVETQSWNGVWIHLHADLLHAMLSRRTEKLTFYDYLKPYRRPKVFAVWSLRDPLPFLAEWSLTGSKAVTCVLSRNGLPNMISAGRGSEDMARFNSPGYENTSKKLP